jgi:NADPH-dependent curcumin reductase CurA
MSRAVVLARHPEGAVTEQDFAVVDVADTDLPAGFFRTRNRVISLDAGFRQWMTEGAGDNYLTGMQIGDPVQSIVLGEVIESDHPDYPVGILVSARTAWEEQSVLDGSDLCSPLGVASDVPLHQYMGILGPTGMTAWIGLFEIGQPKPGETVVVSAAGGAVGTVVGQLAKAEGCRVIGLTSTRDKADWLENDVGYDVVIDRETQPDLAGALRAACPDGVDIFFDNVGGEALDTVMSQLREQARLVLCGAISQYESAVQPLNNSWELITKRARMEGFMFSDYFESFPKIAEDLQGRLQRGALKSFDAVYEGIETTPRAFCDMMHGASRGKCLVILD